MSLPKTSVQPPSDYRITPLPDPIKGKADWREYRAFRLENGVTVCLVHDCESKTTAAAATVGVGAAADPRSLSGIAHFCEHMCFLGSDKYPGENEYKRYLSQHGGRSNASTSLHTTTYKFDVLAEHAEQAIDIFSHFFVAPLFTESGTEREVNAVDSENSKNLTADARRRLQILKDIADQSHYFTKFSTGNARTIPTEERLVYVRQCLLDFHRKHYRPDNLTVVVAGPQSLDQLEAWVVPRFAPMKQRPFPSDEADMTETERLIQQAAADAPPIEFGTVPSSFHSPFTAKHTPILLTTKPLKSMRRLVLMFPLPSVWHLSDQSPVSVLSHLLGHEGPNSPFAVLQNEGLLSSLSAGPRVSAPDFTLFQVDIGLTELGEARWKQVVDIILQHCRLIQSQAKSDEMKRIWGESATLHAMFFDQTSPGAVYDFCPSLCRRIVSDGTERCLSAGSMLNESPETFPMDAVSDFCSRLVPSNCIIERCSKLAWEEIESMEKEGVKGVQRRTEQWYGIDYFVSELVPGDLRRWEGTGEPFLDGKDLLKLPRPNRYIPRTLELCPELPDEAKQGPRIEKEIDPPKLVIDNEVGRLWHRLDDRYALPKAVVTVLIRNAAVENVKVDGVWAYRTSSSIHSSMIAGMFTEAMAQDTYDADLAGLHWGLSLGPSGIQMTCSGFSDRLPDLALKILREFQSGSFLQEAYFSSTRDRVVRNLRTFFEARRADSNAMYFRDMLLCSEGSGLDVSLATAEAATLDSVKRHHEALFGNDELFVESLYTGNVSERDAKAFFSSALEILSPSVRSNADMQSQRWIPGNAERRLRPGHDVEFHFASKNPEEENGAVLVTYQSPLPGYRGDGLSDEESLKTSASIRLLGHILREPLFDELRTKQTLGYVVSSYYDNADAVRPPQEASLGPLTVPVDFLVVNVLSRKLSPLEVSVRIDDFLDSFRDTLMRMPDSEIHHHATALSTKMLKPIQKLGTEASTHFSKIRRFGPEILTKGGSAQDLPWDSVKSMARMIESLRREHLLETWDKMMHKTRRARIVSCVYGTTFPLQPDKIPRGISKTVVVDDIAEVVKLRKAFPVYDLNPSRASVLSRVVHGIASNRSLFGVATAATLGAGLVGWTILSRSRKGK